MINKNSMNIAKFSFVNALKSKGFIIYNILMLVVIVIATNFTAVKNVFQKHDMFKGKMYEIEIFDENNYLKESLKEGLNVDYVEKVTEIHTNIEYNNDEIRKEQVIIKVLEKENKMHIEVISKEAADGKLYTLISSVAKKVRNDAIETKYGISKEDIEEYNSDVLVEKRILDTDSVIDTDYFMVKTVMIMIIYGLIIFGTSAVASQIGNEKTSKSAEYIFTSVTAKDYLNGKVLGANLKTLANMALMILYLVIGMLINSLIIEWFNITPNAAPVGETGEMVTMILGFDIKTIKYILLSFGYILLTSTFLSYIQAGMTAKVKSINEMDNSLSMTFTIIIVAYMVGMATSEMNNIFTKVISNIPVFSMFVMPTNYLNGVSTIWSILLSLIILIVSIFIVMHVISRKFKQDILDLGPRKEEKRDESKEILEEELNKIKKNDISRFITSTSISMLLLILIQILAGFVIMFFIHKVTVIMNTLIVSAVFILSFLMSIFSLQGFLNISYGKRKNRSSNKKTNIFKWIIMSLPVMYASSWLVEFLTDKMDINPTLLENALVFDKTWIGIILFFIQIAILPAILEELLFRKVMLDGSKKHGTWFAILFTSIMFGLIHMNIPQAINATILGILFAYLTIKTGNIITAMVLHLINNGTQVLLILSEGGRLFSVVEWGYVGITIIGTIILVYNLLKDKKQFKIENKVKTNIKLNNIFKNYYMIVFIIIVVVMFCLQN